MDAGIKCRIDYSAKAVDLFGVESSMKPLFSVEVEQESLPGYITRLKGVWVC